MTTSTIERAYELARSGRVPDLAMLKLRLKTDGCRAVDASEPGTTPLPPRPDGVIRLSPQAARTIDLQTAEVDFGHVLHHLERGSLGMRLEMR